MDIIVCLAVLVFTVVAIGLPYLGYTIPKDRGHRKSGIALGLILALLILHIVYPEPLLKLLFTKNDARALLAFQDFKMQRDLQILENEYNEWSGPAQRLVLKISPEDRIAFIAQIRRTSKNIKTRDSFSKITLANRYFGNPVKISYEAPEFLVCESLTPVNMDGYAPKWQMISISKSGNQLVFEDLYE